jgi:6-phosphogluconate dehydrogenase
MPTAQIGLIGLAVMGQNLARNIASRGYKTVVYNRTTETMEEFISKHGHETLMGEPDLAAFVAAIERPRKIIIMVKAGAPVDAVIEQLLPHLEQGDVILDCGNSNYRDSIRRTQSLTEKGLRFLGTGVSGGEEGALKGPSIMPGGDITAWNDVQPILESIAARDFEGGACVTYVGADGAGHYVKMVHNGIEYGVMQLMAEAYDMLRQLYGLTAPQIAEIFAGFNRGKLNSYLFEIGVPVLSRRDDLTDGYLIDHILDQAGQKGTGKWTAIDALERGIPLPTITEAVYARIVSSRKPERLKLAEVYRGGAVQPKLDLDTFVGKLEAALYGAMLSTYAQGYDLIRQAAVEQNWEINLAEISRIWEGGCIIRAQILGTLHRVYNSTDGNPHLFEIDAIKSDLTASIPALREIVALSYEAGQPAPGLGSALDYFQSMTRAALPANFIQGLRDYFGAHTYNRIDRDGVFHTPWMNE